MAHKAATVERALAVNAPDAADGLALLAAVGGFEIGGLAGVILGAAANRVPVVLDGFISGAAALIAATICPSVRPHLIAAHVSVERGHHAALEWLGLTPLLDLGLRLGEGTGAVLAMPLVDAALAALDEMATFEEAAVAGPLDGVSGTEVVLLVEDESAVRAFIRRALERLGYTVLEAATGADALRVTSARSGPIHLLLTDMVMPGMQGIEVARRVTARRPATRVLFMSGFAAGAFGAPDLPADVDFLAKPFTTEALAHAVRDAIDGHRSGR